MQDTNEIALQRCSVGRHKPRHRESFPNGYADLPDKSILQRTYGRCAVLIGGELQYAGNRDTAFGYCCLRQMLCDVAVKPNCLSKNQPAIDPDAPPIQ